MPTPTVVDVSGAFGHRAVARWLPTTASKVAALVVACIFLLAIVGPYVAPHDPAQIFGAPFTLPSTEFRLGLDYLGEDVWSRVLSGGRSVVALAAVATLLGYGVGMVVGLIAGSTRTMLDPILMRSVDVLLAFPAFVLLLLVIAALGTGVASLIVAIAVLQVPFVARVIRSATLEVSTRGYVESAVARGESLPRILRREVLPSVAGVIAATIGPAFTAAILAVAGISFLGLGLQAPAADWALMMSENKGGITFAPLPVVVPALLIAALTVSVNITADGVARGLSNSSGGES